MSNEKKTVVEWLNGVDYGVDPNYIPSDFALEFVNFIKLVNGTEGEENLTPVIHMQMLDKLAGKEQDLLNLCHRGVAKTTLFGEYLILYLACFNKIPGFGEVPLGLYVSDSIENGVKNMRKNLEHRWENSEFLQKFVPEKRLTDVRWEFTNAAGKKTIFKGYGAKTGVRGAKEMGMRPVLAILDDLISDEDARSATVISSVEDTVYKAVDYALHTHKKKTIWSGTPFNARDPLYKAVESGAWNVNVYPVCERFPCSREEFRGSWPDRFTYDYVERQYTKAVRSGMVETFNQELMLRIMSDEDRLVLDSEINWYERKSILRNKDHYNFYLTTDFATSDKESADFSVLSVWAYNNNGDWFYVDGVAKRQDMGANLDDLFRLVAEYRPLLTGIEVSGQQGGFIPMIQAEMGRRNVYFSMASDNNSNKPGVRPVTNKMVRFQTVVPWFKMGKMYFPVELKESPMMRECMDELTLAAPNGFRSKHDDFIDTISMLSVLKVFKPDPTGDLTSKYDNNTGYDVYSDPDALDDNGGGGYASYIV